MVVFPALLSDRYIRTFTSVLLPPFDSIWYLFPVSLLLLLLPPLAIRNKRVAVHVDTINGLVPVFKCIASGFHFRFLNICQFSFNFLDFFLSIYGGASLTGTGSLPAGRISGSEFLDPTGVLERANWISCSSEPQLGRRRRRRARPSIV